MKRIEFEVGWEGHHRFLSSRKGANGPTLGNVRGQSILDGNGLFARGLRAVRRR